MRMFGNLRIFSPEFVVREGLNTESLRRALTAMKYPVKFVGRNHAALLGELEAYLRSCKRVVGDLEREDGEKKKEVVYRIFREMG